MSCIWVIEAGGHELESGWWLSSIVCGNLFPAGENKARHIFTKTQRDDGEESMSEWA